ncbi:hypothetical protein KP509_38G044700 [Ceratopteris richardii]|uniref:HTH myb-type domain-containing protein n=1 Tax=Ceratopteris richardii TaxID=49495 RepID=A0A8T2Q4A9_CERRI|nr:hypothetical protein KP509_38G044700 [Ceratopteris richardii]KAH7278509.1 hypothetical protein KP509_38G044700 [Ceratopteris richardii]
MASSAELTLGAPYHGMTSNMTLGGSHVERALKLEYYLKALEDERKKIEAFKRELPFCMQLLSDEIEASKEQLSDCQEPFTKPYSTLTSMYQEGSSVRGDNMTPAFEEFMPIKRTDDKNDKGDECSASDTSMFSQLMKPIAATQTNYQGPAQEYYHGQQVDSSMLAMSYRGQDAMQTGRSKDIEVVKPVFNLENKRGAFLPFYGSKEESSREDFMEFASPHLKDRSSPPNTSGEITTSMRFGGPYQQHVDIKDVQDVTVSATTAHHKVIVGQTPQRKPRRCWSAELHRRFVHALQQLGGSEVATPKQIRELMKVDGLTNDEVKSHLQKYRLHTRRPNPANTNTHESSRPHTPQVVVLGGIWMAPEYATQATASANQVTAQPPTLRERQVTHAQATSSYSEESLVQVSPTVTVTPLQLRQEVVTRPPSLVSESPLHGRMRHISGVQHSSVPRQVNLEEVEKARELRSSQVGERLIHEERYDSQGMFRPHVYDLMLNHSLLNVASHESGDEDSEAENGRVYETPH